MLTLAVNLWSFLSFSIRISVAINTLCIYLEIIGLLFTSSKSFHRFSFFAYLSIRRMSQIFRNQCVSEFQYSRISFVQFSPLLANCSANVCGCHDVCVIWATRIFPHGTLVLGSGLYSHLRTSHSLYLLFLVMRH